MERKFLALSVLLTILLLPPAAQAHSKWFSHWHDNLKPVALDTLVQWPWLALVGFSTLAVYLGVYLWYVLPEGVGRQIVELFEQIPHEVRYYTLATAAVMSIALCWRAEVILTPELKYSSAIISLAQFGIITLGVLPQFRTILPLLLTTLYLIAGYSVGPVHMLDYMHLLGIALCLWQWRKHTSDEQIEKGLLIIRITTGFSLSWLGMEKVVYPDWSLEVLAQQPWLSMGLPGKFFVQSAALVEFTIGFFFILGVWVRLAALVLSILMGFTATVFGVEEIVGHLPIHAILVLLITAPAKPPRHLLVAYGYSTLIAAGRQAVLYLLAMGVLGGLYYGFSWQVWSSTGGYV